MINFCSRKSSETRENPFLNVIFLVDTDSPNSYLCTEAMEGILGKNRKVELPHTLTVDINQKNSFEFYLSPVDKPYKDVNVLGMDFFAKQGFSFESQSGKASLERRRRPARRHR